MVVELKVNEKTGKLQPPPGYALVAKPEYDEFGIAIEHPGVEYEPQNWWQYFWGYAKVPKPLEVTHKQRKGGEVLSSSSSSSSRRRRSTLKAGEEYRKERDDNTETTSLLPTPSAIARAMIARFPNKCSFTLWRPGWINYNDGRMGIF